MSHDGRKMYVALMRRQHSYYWFGGHTNFIAEFDLARLVKTKEFQVLADPADLAVTDAGLLLMAGGSESRTARGKAPRSGSRCRWSPEAKGPGPRVLPTLGESRPE